MNPAGALRHKIESDAASRPFDIQIAGSCVQAKGSSLLVSVVENS